MIGLNQQADNDLAAQVTLKLSQAQAAFEDGDTSSAEALFLDVVKRSPIAGEQGVVYRLEAYCGLLVITARMKNRVGFDHYHQGLRELMDSHPIDNISCRNQIARQINGTCDYLGARHQWEAVKSLSRLILRLVITQSEDGQKNRIRATNNLASALLAEGRANDAHYLWMTVIEDLDESAQGEALIPLATVHNNLGEIYRLQCQFEVSLKHHLRALELRRSRFPAHHNLIRQSLLSLSQLAQEMWDYPLSRKYINELERIISEHGTISRTEDIRKKLLEARLELLMGKWLTAESLIDGLVLQLNESDKDIRIRAEVHLTRLEVAIELRRSQVIEQSIHRIEEMIILYQLEGTIIQGRLQFLKGRALIADDNARDAEELFQQSIKIHRTRLPWMHPRISDCLTEMAVVFSETQRKQRAIQTINSGLSLLEKVYGDHSLPVMDCLSKLGNIIIDRKQAKAARNTAKIALAMRREHNYQHPPTMARIYQLLSEAYELLNRKRLTAWFAVGHARIVFNQLETPLESRLDILERALPLVRHFEWHQLELELLSFHWEAMVEKNHPHHPEVAEVCYQQGEAHFKMQQFEEAKQAYQQAMTIWKSACGEESKENLKALKQIIECERKLGHEDKATELDQLRKDLYDRQRHVLNDLFDA